MELSQLKNFMAVIECGAISKAAQKLGVAQPALSQSISRMEKSLGVTLFERSRRGASPTAAALAIVDDVQSGLFKLGEAQKKAQAAKEGKAGILKIGLVSSALFEILPAALRQIKQAAPGLLLELSEMSNEEQAKAVADGIIDIGLIHPPITVPGRFHQKTLRQDKLIAAVPQEFGENRPGVISLEEISAFGLVLYPKEQLPHLYAGIAEAIRELNCELKVNQLANRTLTVLACVAAGVGIGLLPSWIQSVSFPGVVFREITNGHHLPTFDLIAISRAKSAALLSYF